VLLFVINEIKSKKSPERPMFNKRALFHIMMPNFEVIFIIKQLLLMTVFGEVKVTSNVRTFAQRKLCFFFSNVPNTFRVSRQVPQILSTNIEHFENAVRSAGITSAAACCE